jgi:hypothetical protein
VVEGPVLADKYDQMLDRRIGVHAMSGIVSIIAIVSRRQSARHQGNKYSAQRRRALPAHSLQNL